MFNAITHKHTNWQHRHQKNVIDKKWDTSLQIFFHENFNNEANKWNSIWKDSKQRNHAYAWECPLISIKRKFDENN